MKKIIMSLALMLMAVVAVYAQQPENEKSMGPSRLQHFRQHGRGMMAKKLNFSDQQKEQLKNINGDYQQKITDLKKHDEITVKEFKTQMIALHKEHRDQLQALLTPEQKDQLAKMKEKRMEMAKVNAGAKAEKMKIKLGLSDAQASQLKEMHSSTFTKIKSIHADNVLTPDQKHEQIKSLVLQQKEQLKTILTTAQLEQLQQMRAQHKRMDFSK